MNARGELLWGLPAGPAGGVSRRGLQPACHVIGKDILTTIKKFKIHRTCLLENFEGGLPAGPAGGVSRQGLAACYLTWLTAYKILYGGDISLKTP